MDSLETNKAFAAVLLAGIAFVGAGLVANALVKPKELHQAAIKIDIPEAAGAATASNAPDPPLALLLASADVGRGEAGVKAQGCVACHSFNQGGFAYSAVLKAKQGPWTLDEMSDWLKKPNAYAPGTKMSYAGLGDAKKRADIVLYLRSLSANPVPLPEAPAASAAAAPAAGAAPAPAGDTPIEQRLASADVKAGQADTMKLGCIACHTYVEGGKAGIGPNMWNVVGGNIGSHMEGYQYSAALKGKGGKWTDAELDKWLTKPAAYAPGTKMTFMGVADPKQRADVIAYLHTLANNPIPLPTK